MNADHKESRRRIGLLITPPHPCSYLPEREATTQFIDPACSLDSRFYGQLLELGFRRSGEYVYRPRCGGCEACLPARIAVAGFTPSRSQRRCWNRNHDIYVNRLPAAFHEEHYALYRRYLANRHPGGDMGEPAPDQYLAFLGSDWCDTVFYEFRAGTDLLAVAVSDRVPHALSAVYTFYEPAQHARGLGVLAVLWQIQEARAQGLQWLYLGYWIESCAKMRYKSQYKPLEIRQNNCWNPLEENNPRSSPGGDGVLSL